ncbi:MAG: hydrogenase maturation nickel metallochaperone HypA [Woeseiaceae bacterium]|nr:hydrogenase maturation nickel metallochaperone HypA [Woeseiaceae bacterium]
MHELSVCLSLLEQVERIAAEHDAVSVERIVLKVGPLSGIEADLLASAYPLAATGTIAADAELVIEECGVRVRCTQCEAESDVPANRLICSECGDFRTRVVRGEEMILQRLEFSA